MIMKLKLGNLYLVRLAFIEREDKKILLKLWKNNKTFFYLIVKGGRES